MPRFQTCATRNRPGLAFAANVLEHVDYSLTSLRRRGTLPARRHHDHHQASTEDHHRPGHLHRVWQHFVVEKRLRSVKDPKTTGSQCLYRSPKRTLACGVGILVTDKECVGWDDGGDTDVRGIMRRGRLPERLVPHVDFLASIQAAHDGAKGRRLPANRLREVAAIHGLTIPGAK
jgi:hypothetical protein